MLPRVVVFTAVSVDGRTDFISPDQGQFYGLVGTWSEDVTLAGCETMLVAAETNAAPEDAAAEAAALRPAAADGTKPLLAVVDSRGRVASWRFWRAQPYWRGAVALCATSTPRAYIESLPAKGVELIEAGDERVDLHAALEELQARYHARVVRVDSGGALSGALLRAGLVSEVSVLITPELVGGSSPRSLYQAPDLSTPAGVLPVRLVDVQRLDNDAVWLWYEVRERAT